MTHLMRHVRRHGGLHARFRVAIVAFASGSHGRGVWCGCRRGDKGAYLKQQLKDKLIEHKQYIETYGQDLPEIRNWTWGDAK